MGCDIHLITEVKKNGKWEYVPEIPETLDSRNYNVFAFLAGVRDYFDTKGFPEKGLPEDISGKKFHFKSDSPYHHRRYEEQSEVYLLTPDGKYHREYGDKSRETTIEVSAELYEKIKDTPNERYRGPYWSESRGIRKYYIKDAAVLDGKWVTLPNKDVYATFEEFEKDVWGDEDWDELAQDYGHWSVNFDCEDYHSHSYLTLGEFLEADYTDYTSHKYKMSRNFYDAFIAAGGVLPNGFVVRDEHGVGDIMDAFREAFNPTVLVAWPMSDEEKAELPVFKGVEELKGIAKQYNIENPEHIRIVFAFDN